MTNRVIYVTIPFVMKKIGVVCAGYNQDNLVLAADYSRWVTLTHKYAVFNPELMYPVFLQNTKSEISLITGSATSFLSGCDEIWVFVVNGVVTPTMSIYIASMVSKNVPVHYFAVEVVLTPGDNLPTINLTQLAHLPTDRIPSTADLLSVNEWAKNTDESLKDIEKRLKGGESLDTIDADLDKVLGIVPDTQDVDKNLLWETMYRGNKSGFKN